MLVVERSLELAGLSSRRSGMVGAGHHDAASVADRRGTIRVSCLRHPFDERKAIECTSGPQATADHGVPTVDAPAARHAWQFPPAPFALEDRAIELGLRASIGILRCFQPLREHRVEV